MGSGSGRKNFKSPNIAKPYPLAASKNQFAMNSLNAIESDFLSLPKSYNDSTSFLDFIDSTLKNYLTIIESINEGSIVEKLKENIEKIKFLCESLVEAYKQLHLGFIFKSYHHFDLGLKEVESFLFSRGIMTHPLSEIQAYYRGRKCDKTPEKSEMFHLPFQKRHLATTQRFSIPGLPCLYLGDSAYVCWEELNRPVNEEFYISRYEICDYLKLKTLDISMTPKKVATMIKVATKVTGNIDTWDKLTLEYLIKWPLIFCCSIKVKNEDAPFKPEYIIPQYLLDWVRSNKNFNCIKYFSIKTNLFQNIDNSSFTNVVIPVQEIQEKGFCNTLLKSLSFTEPECMNNIDNSAKISKDEIENYIQNYRHDSLLFINLKDFEDDYLQSKFGRMEIKLSQKTTE